MLSSIMPAEGMDMHAYMCERSLVSYPDFISQAWRKSRWEAWV